MKQIYNFTETGPPPKIGTAELIFALIFTFFFIVGVIRLISSIKNGVGILTHISTYIAVIAAIVVPISYFIILTSSYMDNKETYYQCLSNYNSGNYFTVEGKINNLFYSKRDNDTDYYIAFSINDTEFVPDSFKPFGNTRFTDDEINLLETSQSCSVEYTQDDDDEIIILTICVKTG